MQTDLPNLKVTWIEEESKLLQSKEQTSQRINMIKQFLSSLLKNKSFVSSSHKYLNLIGLPDNFYRSMIAKKLLNNNIRSKLKTQNEEKAYNYQGNTLENN